MEPQVIAYTRVSSKPQQYNSSLATQRFAIHRYAGRAGLEVTRTIREVSSAYRNLPPKLADLPSQLPPGSKIIVFLVDRFCRNIAHGTLLLDIFRAGGIEVIEVEHDQRTNTILGRMHFDRRIQSAQDESEAKAARMLMYAEYKDAQDEDDAMSNYSDEADTSSDGEEVSSSDSDAPSSPEPEEDMDE
jgi:DNA invertase Pin-like site-specific DNA recombinase